MPAPAARQAVRLAATALALAAATACTTAGSAPAAPVATPGPAAVGAAAASSPVAELQAGLTALLVERTYLVAGATDAVAASGGRLDVAAPAAALVALDAGSVALADVLGATYTEARSPLLRALRREDALLAQHAVALATGDAAAAAAAREELAQAQAELARTARRVVPMLDAPEVATRLGADVSAQLPPRSYERLRTTAALAAGTARLLAAGIAADRALGNPGTEAARLRADVTALMTEHVALVVAQARELDAGGARAASAAAALDANAAALAQVVGEHYPAAQTPFLRSWSAHLDRLARYSAARAAGAAADPGLVRGYPTELARLLAAHVRELPEQGPRTELDAALSSLLRAVQAAAGDDADAPSALRQATADALPAAALISAAMAEDLRLR